MINTNPLHPPLLETRHLGRSVADKVLVTDISFQVYANEIVALVGSSGAGKTSLLRLLNRLDEPTSGTVLLAGRDYRSLPPRELRCQVGFMMQQPVLFPGTVADNIRFGPHQRGLVLADAEIDMLLAQVGLEDYAFHDTARLSGGEAQRVALLRTLANQPCVLLLDEPTSALDAASEQAVEVLIQQWVQQYNIACVLISHQQAQIKRLAQRTLQLVAGHLVHPDIQPEVHNVATAYH